MTPTATDLPEPEEPFIRWAGNVDAWRERHHVPDTVLPGTGDQQPRLTLTDEHHLRLLRTDLRRHPTLTLGKALTADDEPGWFDGRMHEIILCPHRPAARAQAQL